MLTAPLALALAVFVGVDTAPGVPPMLAPALREDLDLAHVAIVCPGSETGRQAGVRLCDAVARAGGDAVLKDPTEALDETGLRLRPEVAAANHILLGDINSNRALLPYYVDLLDFSDAYMPGPGGYVIRSVPEGTGFGGDCLVVGASDDAGLDAGVARLVDLLDASADGRLAYTFEAQLTGGVANAVLQPPWSEPYDPARWTTSSPMDMASLPGYVYALSAQPTAARMAFAGLLRGATADGWYPVSDYELEWLTRAWGYVRDAECVSPEDAATTDGALYETLVHYENEFWRRRDGSVIGGRHQTMGTSAFYAAVRLLLRRGQPTAEARQRLETWRDECAAYFANAARAFHDDMEGIPTYHSFQPVCNEALRSGDAAYVEANLDLAVGRALAVTDNLGYYAGTGTYEEARPGAARAGIMLGYPLAVSAYLRDDSGSEWLLRHFAGVGRGTWGLMVGFGARAFTRPVSAPAAEPRGLLGVMAVPLGPYRESRYASPHDGALFEKLCLRNGFGARDQYMVLEGYQGAGADNLPPRDANSIIRYTDLGHIWLCANSERSGNFERSAVYVSDGLNATHGSDTCELLQSLGAGPVALVASRLRDYVSTEWTRNIVWRKGAYYVVIDEVLQRGDEECGATCSFRTPCFAEPTPTGMRAIDGDASMEITGVDGYAASVTRSATREGAIIPTMLRQRTRLPGGDGEGVVFRNLLQAREPGQPPWLAARPAGRQVLMVCGELADGPELALIGVCRPGDALSVGPFELAAPLFYISPTAVVPADGSIRLSGAPLGGSTGVVSLTVELTRLWESLPTPGTPSTAGTAMREADRLWSFDGFDPVGEPVLGVDIMTDPEPVSGLALDLVDGMIPLWQGVAFPGGQDVSIRLRLREPVPIDSIEIATGLVAGVNGLPNPQAGATRSATLVLDGTPRSVAFSSGYTCEPLHKGCVLAMGRWRARVGDASARDVEIGLPATEWPADSGFREVIVRRVGASGTAPTHACCADINGDGRDEVVVATDTGEVDCLRDDGTPVWRRYLMAPVTALECLDLGDGEPAVLVTTREANLHRFKANGDEAWEVSFLSLANENSDLPTAYSIGQWLRPDGEPEIVCGNYNACSLVRRDGSDMSYCRAAGAFETMLLPRGVDLNGDGVQDQLLYNVWQSGTVVDGASRKATAYRSLPGGDGLYLGPMPGDPDPHRVLVAAENGVGLMDAATGQYVWRRDVAPLTGCVVGRFPAVAEGLLVVVTKRDGFVLVFSADGELLRKTPTDDLLMSAAVVPGADGGDILVAASEGRVIAFDADLRTYGEVAPVSASRLMPTGDPGTFMALGTRGSVEAFRLR